MAVRQRVRLAALLFATACNTGEIGEPAGSAGSSEDNSMAGQSAAGAQAPTRPGQATKPMPTEEASFVPAPGGLRKLTVEQYDNSVRDLLGADVQLPPDISLEPDVAQNGFYAVGASKATVSPAAAEKYEQAAYAMAAQALVPNRRAALVPCTPAAVSDSACAQKALEQLGRRAFRRPLRADELARYVKLANDASQALGDFYQGLEFGFAAVLQSPNFLFRVELGARDPAEPNRLKYSDFELASRLSYALWNTTPDEQLLSAAQEGELSGSGLLTQTTRLLADPRALRALDNFHSERLGLSELLSLSKDPKLIGELSDSLRAGLRDDVLRTFAELGARPGQDVLQVFDSRVAYVNGELAGLYGLPATVASSSGTSGTTRTTDMTRTELPANAPRLGFLGKPAFLALTSHNVDTSPTLRGKYIRERVLCESIPAPPANVVPVLGEPDPDAPTMRDRLQAHATDPSCSSCHTKMDPLGLSLEHFDALGRYRASDNGHALDTTGELDGQRFDGAVELSQLLRRDPRTAECLVRQAYRYMLGHVEQSGEEPAIERLLQAFVSSNHDLTALFRALSTSDAFRYAAKESP